MELTKLMKKDIEIIEGIGPFIFRNLPLIVCVFSLQILKAYISWPLAVGFSGFIFGTLSYWIPERSSGGFRRWVVFSAVISGALSLIAHIVIQLGWVPG
jgi:hypothetical protein